MKQKLTQNEIALHQRCTKEVKGHNVPGAESLGGVKKSLTMSQVLYSIQYTFSQKTLGSKSTWGRQTCFLHRALSNDGTPMLGILAVTTRYLSFINGHVLTV